MKTTKGLVIFVSFCISGGIFIGIWIPFLMYHYYDQATANNLWSVFSNPLIAQVPLSGLLALIFSILAVVTSFYLQKSILLLKYKDD